MFRKLTLAAAAAASLSLMALAPTSFTNAPMVSWISWSVICLGR